jgi:hypothetical protein
MLNKIFRLQKKEKEVKSSAWSKYKKKLGMLWICKLDSRVKHCLLFLFIF